MKTFFYMKYKPRVLHILPTSVNQKYQCKSIYNILWFWNYGCHYWWKRAQNKLKSHEWEISMNSQSGNTPKYFTIVWYQRPFFQRNSCTKKSICPPFRHITKLWTTLSEWKTPEGSACTVLLLIRSSLLLQSWLSWNRARRWRILLLLRSRRWCSTQPWWSLSSCHILSVFLHLLRREHYGVHILERLETKYIKLFKNRNF